MKRAILVTTGTVVGVAATLAYNPQAALESAFASSLTGISDTGAASPADAAAAATTTQAAEATPSAAAAATTTPQATAKATTKATAKATTKTTTSTNKATTSTSSSGSASTSSSGTSGNASATQSATGSSVQVTYREHGRLQSSGPLQVRVNVVDGVVKTIDWLTYPQGEHMKYSQMTYQMVSAPLEGQTLASVKKANLSTASGATGTSEAFIKSLQSALQQL